MKPLLFDHFPPQNRCQRDNKGEKWNKKSEKEEKKRKKSKRRGKKKRGGKEEKKRKKREKRNRRVGWGGGKRERGQGGKVGWLTTGRGKR